MLALVMQLVCLAPGWADAPVNGDNGLQQPQLSTHPVFLDGQFLFRVPGAADLTAAERANAIEGSLAPLINSPNQVNVRVETRGTQTQDGWRQSGTPVIFANDRYIMSITSHDVQTGDGESLQEQAALWADTIDQNLELVRADRRGGLYWQAWMGALLAILVAFGIHWLAGQLWHNWLSPLVSRMFSWSEATAGDVTGLRFLFHLSLFILRLAVWLTAIAYIASLFPLTRRLRYLVSNSLQEGFFSSNLQLGSQTYSLFNLLLLLIVLLGLVIAASAVTNLLRSRFLRMTGISVAAQEAIAILSKYSLMLLGGVVILQLWGIDLSSIALIASGLGIGIGLGLQNIVKDFVSGLVMVFERPVQVGDFVDFGQVKGTVTRIGSRSTEIRTLDHVTIIVPNSRFLESEVFNWSHGNPVSRLRLPVGVAYGSDPEKVKDALLDACQQDQSILSTPAPDVFFNGFGESTLQFEVLVWINTPSRQMFIRSDLYFAIEASLRRHQITLPFPQRDLHIRSGYLPIGISPEDRQLLQQLGHLTDEGARGRDQGR